MCGCMRCMASGASLNTNALGMCIFHRFFYTSKENQKSKLFGSKFLSINCLLVPSDELSRGTNFLVLLSDQDFLALLMISHSSELLELLLRTGKFLLELLHP